MIPIWKGHLSAPVGVLAVSRSSTQCCYASGLDFAAALTGTQICSFWTEIGYINTKESRSHYSGFRILTDS